VEFGLRQRAKRFGRDHPLMIGSRAHASAALAILGLAAVLAPRHADPAVDIEGRRLVRVHAAEAVSSLDELLASIQPGLDAARAAAATVVSGDAPPSGSLAEAGDLIAGAEAGVAPARRAVAALTSARIARDPAAAPVPQPIGAGELSSIGAQLGATGEAADAFVEVRTAALGVPATLERALAALEDGSLDEAAELVGRARADHDAVDAWETDLPTLPMWLGTTDAMIDAVEQILDATRRGDARAAAEAADVVAGLAEEAGTADRALRIALSEGGSALTSAPLERLAAALREIESSRAATARLLADPEP
jgi:hypothetical protein